VTRAVNSELRELRVAEPRKAQAVEDLIKSIPHTRSEPVRIDVPGAPHGREYLAALPYDRDAPVVIYRHLQPDESPDGDWLVTALVDRDEYNEYQRAAMQGILDNPAVREITARLGGTVATIVNNADQGRAGQGGRGT
jgi:hypothetical protein